MTLSKHRPPGLSQDFAVMAALLSAVVMFHPIACRASDPISSSRDLQIDWTPRRPFIERRGAQQLVNFDVLVRNTGAQTYRLVSVKVAVFDNEGRLELARELNEDGRPPAIESVGDRHLPGGLVSGARVGEFKRSPA